MNCVEIGRMLLSMEKKEGGWDFPSSITVDLLEEIVSPQLVAYDWRALREL